MEKITRPQLPAMAPKFDTRRPTIQIKFCFLKATSREVSRVDLTSNWLANWISLKLLGFLWMLWSQQMRTRMQGDN